MTCPHTIFGLAKGERSKALLMFLYFFIIIACYWFLKPLRSVLTVEKLGADSIRELKVLTALVSAGVVILYSLVMSRLSREKLAYLVLGAFFWLLMFFSLSFERLASVRLLYYCFYIFLDLFITVNITLFWTMMADINTTDRARYTYGLVGVGGILGGFFGSFYCKQILDITGPGTMMAMVLAAYSLIFVIVFMVSRKMASLGHKDTEPVVPSGANRLSDALAGARQVLRSRYFLMICLLLASYELVSTVNDYAFHKSVEITFQNVNNTRNSLLFLISERIGNTVNIDITASLANIFGIELGRGTLASFFSEFFLLMNIVAVLAQLIITPIILKNMAIALLFLPVVLIVFSSSFLLLPILTAVELLFLSDNSFNYSVNQTSREMLFLPAKRVDKYKTLAFIDMFVLRLAKALAGFFLLVLPLFHSVESLEDLRWYMLVTITICLIWMGLALALGLRYRSLCARRQE